MVVVMDCVTRNMTKASPEKPWGGGERGGVADEYAISTSFAKRRVSCH